MRKKLCLPFFITIVAVFVSFGCLLANAQAAAVPGTLTKADLRASFEKGALYEHDGVKLVDLHGTWEEMGRQYGYLLKNELHDICYKKILDQLKDKPELKKEITNLSKVVVKNLPNRLRDFYYGASQTSGLSVDELKIANAVEYIVMRIQCSAMAVWGDYAKGPLVYGRNYDYNESFREFGNDLVVTVFHPADESLGVATVGYAGEIYTVNAMNEKGIFLELNNGCFSGGNTYDDNRLLSTAAMLMAMFDATGFDYIDAFFETVRSGTAYIIGVADAHEAKSYEWDRLGMEHGESATPPGLMAMTNHYNVRKGIITPTDESSFRSLTRRKNLIDLAEKNKGKIDAARMRELFGLTIEQGGPTMAMTVYQLVAEPETRRLWLKITGTAPWTEIDFNEFFAGKDSRADRKW